jgi:fused signal recognition particle receptor
MPFKWFKKKDNKTKDGEKTVDSGNEKTPEPQIKASPKPEPVDVSWDAPDKSGFMARLKDGLSKTRRTLNTDIDVLFTGKKAIDDDFLDELEEILITADLGVQTTRDLLNDITDKSKTHRISDAGQLKAALKAKIVLLLKSWEPEKKRETTENEKIKPEVIMVVGVNGVGKTTTIGKLAAQYRSGGKKVIIAASDTFRAGAGEQLDIWAKRAGADIIRGRENADPASVAYDAVDSAIARNVDIVLIDTAGRLHTKVNLMEQLKKIKRTIAKKYPGAPHETMLVLDATTGQNAISQAKLFHDAISVSSLTMTKLDGTARGGIVVTVCNQLQIPLKYIGVGEKIEDLQIFDPVSFADALF